jgi:hypothetical protein
MGAMLTLSVSVGCGSAVDLDAKDCCKSMCQHAADSKDPEKCCQQNKQSQQAVTAQLVGQNLSKKVFDSVLLSIHPVDVCFTGVLLREITVSPPKVLKFPQLEIYKLTSALLI